jgi:hypothetical protein
MKKVSFHIPQFSAEHWDRSLLGQVFFAFSASVYYFLLLSLSYFPKSETEAEIILYYAK